MRDLGPTLTRHRKLIGVAVVLLLIALGFTALEHLTSEIHFSDVRAAVHALPADRLALALLFTVGSYVALTFYDVLALRVIGRPLPWRTAALASFTSYTLSHNLGLSLLTGGSARYRVYTAAGLDGADVARVVAIAGGAFWAGVVTVTGIALLSHDGAVTVAGLTLGQGMIRFLGWSIVVLAALLVTACGAIGKVIRLFGFAVPLPTSRQGVMQIAIAALDIALASAALFVLIPGASTVLLPQFVLAYTLGIVAAVVTHVPGGLGVFEAVVLAVVPVDRATLFAALIAYRIIYYLLPLAAGIVMLAWRGSAERRASLRLLSGVRELATGVAPLALSAATFMGGAMLLLSGSLPSLHDRMGLLANVLPLPFIEASHIAASLVGTGLLLLAPSLYRRLDGAFVATRALLVAGAVFSLAKGFDYEEAIVCLSVAALLQSTRAAFYRRTTLTSRPGGAAWLASMATMIALTVWTGFFAYRHIDYSGDLWWQFALHGDASRFLRALLGMTVVLAGAGLWRLMAPARAATVTGGEVDPAVIRPILDHAVRTDAMLALTGDKRFLVSAANDCFLMYQVVGASWIVMGDPVGAHGAWGELLWRLRDLADRQQGRLLLYEVSSPVLDIAIGMGLNIIKYGEEAIIDLDGFTFDAPGLRGVRRSERNVARKGGQFRLVPAAAVSVIADELAAISDAWLAAKHQREKGFSLGHFDRAYLANFDVGIVTVDDRIVAFANIWRTANMQEVSIDLMRHGEDAPSGTMDFLFAHLIRWAGSRGYARFSLGTAPLSGIEDRRLAPAWAKTAAFVFRHGERFYGFRGLRGYKEKFAPRWEPRYIAGPHGIGLLQALRDLSRLIGRPQPAPPRARVDTAPPVEARGAYPMLREATALS
ncbi:bifunctional lysylphosphatidylglycerol flippase/synthetase MprF [Sphingomonas sp. SUN019]|uniref:bifunctional lysylphosphatidylglycerol flippase/synthetase MprF n=1 Tax=Sphingomonas sp. SUN019 TaxID=2937788 RepID=UPI00216416BC|nr:bifunctional lysylphosphatidylglycerol flippase/synthetase MprF [Sphingomonas sp. SUN019]UVO50703.1 bifunctional lysylphosphatidylglycerol flippase/synthetase MprF [Sphingomonas sp. SUN019]